MMLNQDSSIFTAINSIVPSVAVCAIETRLINYLPLFVVNINRPVGVY